MRTKTMYLFLLSGTLCTSCLTPPVAEKQPTYAMEGSWKHEAPLQDAPIATKDHWWEIFEDPTLNALVEKGLENSPSIEKALARFDEASWYTTVAGADQFPQISFNGYGDRRRIPKSLRTSAQVPTGNMTTPQVPEPIVVPPLPVPATVPPVVVPVTPEMKTVKTPKFVNNLIADFFVSYEIDFWGKYYLNTKAAKARADATQDDIETAKLLLVNNIASTYFTIQAVEKELAYLREEISLHTKRVALLNEQFEKGLTNEFQLLQERASLEAKVTEEQSFIQTHENNLSLLAVLVGEHPNCAEFTINPAAWNFPMVPPGIPSSLLANRPDIKSSMKEIDAIISEIGVAKTELLPSLTLSGAAGYQAGKANKWFQWRNRIWSMAASIAQPIFDAGKRIAEVEATKARFHQAVASLTDAVLSSIKEVEDALVLIQTQKERTKAATSREKDLSLVESLRQELYTKGAQDLIMVLQAQEDLVQAKRTLLQEQYNLQLGSLGLIKSLGGRW